MTQNGHVPLSAQPNMSDRIRDYDWASTPLGPLSAWPSSLRSIVQMMLGQRHAICMVWGSELTFLYNDAYAPILGTKEARALGRPFKEVWSDVWDGIRPFVDQAMSGEGTWSEELPLTMTRNGYPEETYWTFSYSPLYDGDAIVGMINVALDATSVVASRLAQETLQREMTHRMKNTLAVATAVVSSTLRNANNLEEARATVSARIAALSTAQDYLHTAEDGADISTVIEVAIAPHLDRSDRSSIDGPSVGIIAQQAVGLSLAIYELATNATKYGALSNDVGHVDIQWSVGDDGQFVFEWKETGGPRVEQPSRTGFGSKLTNKIVASYFGGNGETHYEPDGVRYVLKGVIDR